MTRSEKLTYSGAGEKTIDVPGPIDVTVTSSSDLTLVGIIVGPLTIQPGATVRFRGKSNGMVFVGAGATLVIEQGSEVRGILNNRGIVHNLGTRQGFVLTQGEIDDREGVVLKP